MPDTFGSIFSTARIAAGYTLDEVAGRIGVSRLTVYRWERGEHEPAWSGALAAIEELGLPLEAFIPPTMIHSAAIRLNGGGSPSVPR